MLLPCVSREERQQPPPTPTPSLACLLPLLAAVPVSGESHPARCHCSASDSLRGKWKAVNLRAVNCRQEFLSLSGWVVSVASPSPCTKDDKHHVHLQKNTATTQQLSALLCEAGIRHTWLPSLCINHQIPALARASKGRFVHQTPHHLHVARNVFAPKS